MKRAEAFEAFAAGATAVPPEHREARFYEWWRDRVLADRPGLIRAIAQACPEIPVAHRAAAAECLSRGAPCFVWRVYAPTDYVVRDLRPEPPQYVEKTAVLGPAYHLAMESETAIERGNRVHKEIERGDQVRQKIVAQVHDEIIFENLTNAPAPKPLAPTWRCAGRSCPERAPIQQAQAPKCYTCDRPMAKAADSDDLLIDRDGFPQFTAPNKIGDVAAAIDRLKNKLAGMSLPPMLLMKAEPKSG